MLSADRRQASSGGRRPSAPSPSSAFGAGSWRRYRVHTRLRMGDTTLRRGSRETPGSLAGAPSLDRSGRFDRPTRLVRRGSSRPQRAGNQRPTREPAVAASGVHDALPRADVGGCERSQAREPVPFCLSSLRQGIEAEGRDAVRRLGSREPGAGRLRRAGATILV
jgi:hypothetical protein